MPISPAHFLSLNEGGLTPPVAHDSLVDTEHQSQSEANVRQRNLQPRTGLSSSMVNNFFVKGSCQECDTEELLTVCENCDGAGEFVSQHITGYDPRDGSPLGWEDQYPCPDCDGTGRVLTEVEPITLDDLEEAFGCL